MIPVTFTFDIDQGSFEDDIKEFYKFYQVCLEES